jgi:hypothetical protein
MCCPSQCLRVKLPVPPVFIGSHPAPVFIGSDPCSPPVNAARPAPRGHASAPRLASLMDLLDLITLVLPALSVKRALLGGWVLRASRMR